MKLYQISTEYAHALDQLSEMQLSPEEIEDSLSALKLELKEKVLATGAYIKNLDLDIDQVKIYEAQAKERRMMLERRKESLQKYLKFYMQQAQLTKIEGIEFDVKVQSNPPRADIVDEKILPASYYKEKFIAVIDKAQVRRDLLNGLEVSGAKLIQEKKVVIK